MEEYLLNYETYTKKVVFKFNVGMGGTGDFLKFFMYSFQLCMKYKVRFFYLLDSNLTDTFLKLKYENMYITQNSIDTSECKFISNINDFDSIIPDIYYIIDCIFTSYYSIPNLIDTIIYKLDDLFYFTDEVISASKSIIKNNYISIHLRLGDAFMEGDIMKIDIRKYNEELLFDFIDLNSHKTIFFSCDNYNYKMKIKEKYNFINITDFKIGHTGIHDTPRILILNAIAEFYLLSKSEYIYMVTNSGFPILAGKFNNIPVIHI